MTRNDTFFKILFAIEIALLPLVMASYILLPKWSAGLIVAGVLVVRIWMELFKNKEDKVHTIVNSIASILTISSLVIFFTINEYINLILCIFIVSLAVLTNIFQILLKDKHMPEMIDAVDSCYVLFECLLLIGLTFVIFYDLVANIALFALLLTSAVSVLYKVYFLCRYYRVGERIKNLFRRR